MHICQFLGVGGLEKVLYSLIKEQIKLGHQVEVVVYDFDRSWVEKFRNELNIKVHTDYNKRDGYDFHLLRYLKKIIQGQDIIHTHDLNPILYIGVLKFINPTMRIIHTTHGMEHLDTHPKTRFYEIFLGIIANCIIAVSPKFQEYYQNQIFTKNSKVHLIDNGTEIEENIELAPDKTVRKEVCAEFNLDQNISIGIYVARVFPLKAQLKLIESYQNINHQLLIIGPSANDDYFKKCQNQTNNRIIMTGSRADISRLLKASDYYISSSTHEGLPISVLEAGAQGLPCLLNNIPGHSTFNNENECVLLFDEFSQLSKKLPHLLNNKETYVDRFIKLIKFKYSSRAMALKYLELYKGGLC